MKLADGYRVIHEPAVVGGKHRGDYIRAYDSTGQRVGSLFFGPTARHLDDEISGSVQVHPQHRRKGIATAMYVLAEKVSGKRFVPDTYQTPSGRALWDQPNRPFGKSLLIKSQLERTDVVSIAVIRAGRLLFGLRRDSGKWNVPGGHVESGEDPRDAAERELKEETGLVGSDWKELGFCDVRAGLRVYSYLCTASGEPDSSADPDEEMEAFVWMPLDRPAKSIMSRLHNPKDVTLQFIGLQEESLELVWDDAPSRTSLAKTEVPSIFRGISHDEHDYIVRSGHILSDQRYCGPGEGTCFGSDHDTAESYVNFGHTSPVATGKPTYVVEVSSGPEIDSDRDGYLKTKVPIPASRIRSVHRYNPDGSVESGTWALDKGFVPSGSKFPHPSRTTPAQWGVRPIVKFESELETWLSKNLGNDQLETSQVAIDMLGFNPQVHPAFSAAQFLSGRPEVSIDQIRRAMYQYDDIVEAAAHAYGLSDDPTTIKAIRAVMGMTNVQKSSRDSKVPAGKDIQAGVSDANEATESIRRAFADGSVKVAHLDGKHSKGSLIARDGVSNLVYLLKPGSGGQSPAAGAQQEHASQSRREAAFWQVADDWGLGESIPRADLIIIDGTEYAAIQMLPFSWRGLEKKMAGDPGLACRVLAPYLNRGFVHRWAVMDFILGNTDRHADNIMVSGDDKLLGLIDHGSAFAGPGFDPAHDQNSFVPFYLRAWAGKNFHQLPLGQKLKQMPSVNDQVRGELADWFGRVHADHLEMLLHRYGIDPRPSIDRLAKVKMMASEHPLDEAINRLWVTV